jgi:hypothetical protein
LHDAIGKSENCFENSYNENSTGSLATSSPDSSKENDDQQNKDTCEKKKPKKKCEQTSNTKPQFGQENGDKNSSLNPMVSPMTQQNSSNVLHEKGETSKTTPDGMKQKSILNWIVKKV